MKDFKNVWLLTVILAVLAAFNTPEFTADAGLSSDISENGNCRFHNEPIVIQSSPEYLLQYWVEKEVPGFMDPELPASPALIDFRDSISGLLDTDPKAILGIQLHHVTGGDSLNVALALKGEAGSIRDMNCLEALLFAEQAERSVSQGKSMYTHPTEFLSYVLTRNDSLMIYFYTVDQPGIRGLGVFNDLLEKNKTDGWVISRNIHNHNFFPGTKMVLGGVVPSATDIQHLRSASVYYGFDNASITNGFHTLDFSEVDFRKFSAGDTDTVD